MCAILLRRTIANVKSLNGQRVQLGFVEQRVDKGHARCVKIAINPVNLIDAFPFVLVMALNVE